MNTLQRFEDERHVLRKYFFDFSLGTHRSSLAPPLFFSCAQGILGRKFKPNHAKMLRVHQAI
jgi:hypothetical protein